MGARLAVRPRGGEPMKRLEQPTRGPWWLSNARLISRAPEMLDALEACVAAGADLQAGKRDVATMGRVSQATDAARALLAFIRGDATEPRQDPCAVLREVLDWYAHSTDADGDMPPELHARLIRAAGGEVAP